MKHQEAIEGAFTSSGLASMDGHAPLLELCRTLAKQMDAAGCDPSTRLTAAYLSALKDLRRATVELPPKAEPGRLAEMRAARGASAGRKTYASRLRTADE